MTLDEWSCLLPHFTFGCRLGLFGWKYVHMYMAWISKLLFGGVLEDHAMMRWGFRSVCGVGFVVSFLALIDSVPDLA